MISTFIGILMGACFALSLVGLTFILRQIFPNQSRRDVRIRLVVFPVIWVLYIWLLAHTALQFIVHPAANTGWVMVLCWLTPGVVGGGWMLARKYAKSRDIRS